jgi:hypothetical protein
MESSGAVVKVDAVSAAFALVFAFEFVSVDELQAAAKSTSAVITTPIKIFLLTSSLL